MTLVNVYIEKVLRSCNVNMNSFANAFDRKTCFRAPHSDRPFTSDNATRPVTFVLVILSVYRHHLETYATECQRDSCVQGAPSAGGFHLTSVSRLPRLTDGFPFDRLTARSYDDLRTEEVSVQN